MNSRNPTSALRLPQLLVILPIVVGISTAQQVNQGLVQQAETKLKSMTPAQIRAKVSQLGMTLEQAEAKAKQYGVDLDAYLQQGGTSQGLPAIDTLNNASSQQGIPTNVDTTAGAEEAQPEELTPSVPPFDSTLIGPGGLHYFGYDVFHNVPAAFEPMAAGPVDPDYLVGPTDVLRINVWGQVEQRNDLEVDNEGRIFIPTVGPVLVSGLTLQQAQSAILKQMSQSYKGLVTSPRTVWLDLTIARLRPKRVFIMGEVKAPGGYTVSTYSTVFDALYSVGGPTVKGSLRDVRLIRNGRVIARVDLYGYLTGSDKINDVRVQDNDIIYIPPRGKTISIRGEVRREAIYELLPDENFRRLLEIAGGILSTTYLERAELDHIIPFQNRIRGKLEREVLDVDLRQIVNQKKDFPVSDGDEVTLRPILELKENYVKVGGAVFRPGRYQLERVKTVRDLILEADSLRPDAYLDRATLLRTRPDSTLESIHLDLSRVLASEPAENIELRPWDSLTVYSKWDIEQHRTVSISGHVRNPGYYPYADSMSLFGLVFRAGGLQDSIYRAQTYMPRAELLRLNPDGITKSILPFNLGALLDSIPGVNRLLRPDDEVLIHEIEVGRVTNDTVEVRGNVRRPGRFHLTSNMTLTDAIVLAGGYTEDAYRLQAEIARIEPKGMGEDSLVYIRFSKLPDLSDTSKQNRLSSEDHRPGDSHLQRYDIVFVRPNPEFKLQQLVDLEGEVRYFGQYALKYPNERLSDVISRAGGLKRSAYLLGGRMTRQRERMNVDFERAVNRPGSTYDVVLQEGDSIFIPPKPNSVTVVGEVNNPGILGFIEGDNMLNYIDRAGGITDSANYALVHFPNGNVERHGFGLFSGNPRVDDGSTVIVTKVPPPPPPTPGVDTATTVKDMFAIVVSAITVIILAQKL